MGICGSKQKVANGSGSPDSKYNGASSIDDIDDTKPPPPTGKPKSHVVKVGGNMDPGGINVNDHNNDPNSINQNQNLNQDSRGSTAVDSTLEQEGMTSPTKKKKKKGGGGNLEVNPGGNDVASEQPPTPAGAGNEKNPKKKRQSTDTSQGPDQSNLRDSTSGSYRRGSANNQEESTAEGGNNYDNHTAPDATPRNPGSPTNAENNRPRIPLMRYAKPDEVRSGASSGIQAPYIDSEILLENPPS